VSGPQQGTVLGETETIERNLSPDWTKIFFLEFSPSEITQLEIVIEDCGNPGRDPLGRLILRPQVSTRSLGRPSRNKSDEVNLAGTSSISRDISCFSFSLHLSKSQMELGQALLPYRKESTGTCAWRISSSFART
jgi:hypothetical protein